VRRARKEPRVELNRIGARHFVMSSVVVREEGEERQFVRGCSWPAVPYAWISCVTFSFLRFSVILRGDEL
jgi:hypothetical protein